MRPLVVAVGAVVLSCGAMVSGASADATFHTQQIALIPVNGSPLHTGFVIDTHTNGPTIYAHEVYVLNGAQPNTTYNVQLLGFANGSNCSGMPLAIIPEATFQTNAAGNGTAGKFFTPQDVAPFRHSTLQLQWQVLGPGGVAYQTACVTVALD